MADIAQIIRGELIDVVTNKLQTLTDDQLMRKEKVDDIYLTENWLRDYVFRNSIVSNHPLLTIHKEVGVNVNSKENPEYGSADIVILGSTFCLIVELKLAAKSRLFLPIQSSDVADFEIQQNQLLSSHIVIREHNQGNVVVTISTTVEQLLNDAAAQALLFAQSVARENFCNQIILEKNIPLFYFALCAASNSVFASDLCSPVPPLIEATDHLNLKGNGSKDDDDNK